ncbi:U-scoloptoxin(01)-Cw1a-like [Onthophagus taurus]|uniref:U-scoloptoxin(01)-Cw1a-like n=1 Tax=Onthophagus taurus TaxID=166361 RepID=UPI000C20F5E5|nr:uncharacterized protein LOC111420946 [Onthophagus taurus]XP_022909816.1 uncharacterized protein LOC111420946 [Onthophagus taurus]
MYTKRCVFLVVLAGFLVHVIYSQLDGYIPGQDYPIYSEVPQGLSFRCEQRPPGYYSDPEAQCQVWHWCLPSGQKFSFLCPNGTIFNQFARVCDWWFNVDCANVPSLYNINDDLYKVPPSNQRGRAGRSSDNNNDNEENFQQ